MTRLVTNSTQHVLYCYAETGKWVETKDLLSLRPRPTIEDAEVYLSGSSDIPSTTGSYLPVAGLCAIPPGTSWWVSPNSYRFAYDLQLFRRSPADLNLVLRYARRLLSQASHSNFLGVELSGGLDSSIIITLLMQCGIPFGLIGMWSDRYEFRTERDVQMYYATRCPTVRLFSGRDIPAFSRLDEVPPHPFPTMGSLNFAQAQKKLELCKEIGVTTLLSGDAGDRLLSFSPPKWKLSGQLPDDWSYWNLAQNIWTDQHIFSPDGVRFLSGFSVGRLPMLILQLRSEQDEDRMKIWTRRMLRPYLPSILSDYAYKAFHDGWIVDGILAARKTIRKMSELAMSVVPHPELTPNKIEELMVEFRKLNSNQREQLLLRLSFVTWIYSNHR